MRAFSISTEVDASADRVWQVMSDVERWHEWTPSVTAITRLDTGPLAVGSQAMIRQPRLPPALWKVVEIEPGRRFTWVSVGPGIRVVASHWVEPMGARTRAKLTLELQGIFGGVFGRLTKGITERYLAFEAKGLKARSEDPSYRHGG